MYDIVFLMNHYGFYKTNLYNEIAKNKKILVIYIGETSLIRNNFFYKGDKKFDFIVLNKGDYENRNKIKSVFKLINILRKTTYNQIVTMGWSTIEDIIISLYSRKSKNSMICESSSYESNITGVKKILKKLILTRYSIIYPSGEPHKQIFDNLGFNGEIRITGGVGVINRGRVITKNSIVNNEIRYLTIARLSKEKNLFLLVKVFNELGYSLTIVGEGPLEEKLKRLAKQNITFIEKVDNINLNFVFSTHHVFILPSISEPWGLVIDEAIYYETPVIVSDKVGCSLDLVQKYKTGLIFNHESSQDLISCIQKMQNNWVFFYENIKRVNFQNLINQQINIYFTEGKK